MLSSYFSVGSSSSQLASATVKQKSRRDDGPVCGLPPPRLVACGGAHTLFLAPERDSDLGARICGWGNNRHNALGMSRNPLQRGNSYSRSFIRADEEEDAARFDIVSDPTDKVFYWQVGMLGIGDLAQENCVPNFFEVACGSNHSVVLEKVETNKNGRKHIASIASGTIMSKEQKLSSSRVWTCGFGSNGQRGIGSSMPGDDPSEVQFPSIVGARAVVQRIVCGANHTLAIVDFAGSNATTTGTPGRVFSWGLGSQGALGIGSWEDAFAPREVWFPGDQFFGDDRLGRCERKVVIVQVAAGTRHSLALGNDGCVYAWGHGGHGRLGTGSEDRGDSGVIFTAQNSPVLAETKSISMRYVAASDSHSASIDQFGGVYTWGQGSHGRLGNGNSTDACVPTRMDNLVGTSFTHVALGLMHSVAVTVKGRLYAWGKGPATGLDRPNNSVVPTPRLVELPENAMVHQACAGPLHTVVLLCDGGFLCFGSSSEGRLPFARGLPKYGCCDQTFPRRIETGFIGYKYIFPPVLRRGASQACKSLPHWWPQKLFCSASSSAMLTHGAEDDDRKQLNTLWVWGSKVLCGQADSGQNNMQDCWKPAAFKSCFRSPVRLFAAGLNHCLAVTDDGMYAWGEGAKGQCGTGSLRPFVTPQFLTCPSDVIAIAAGDEHSACIVLSGKAYTWGSAQGGKLGLGRCLSDGVQAVPCQVFLDESEDPSLRSVAFRAVSCGSDHTAFVSERDELFTCGMGWFGKLGHGNTDNKYNLTLIQTADIRVKNVHCAMYHTCIVDKAGLLWMCGKDSSLCKPSGQHQLEPTLFEPFQDPLKYVNAIATADEHTLAVTFSPGSELPNEIWVWGMNKYGQLGVRANQSNRIDWPLQIDLSCPRAGKCSGYEVVDIATGPSHSLCIVQRGSLDTDAVADGEDEEANKEPIVYAWGMSGSGRLGIETKVESRPPMTRAVLSRRPAYGSCPPTAVDPAWKSAAFTMEARRSHMIDSRSGSREEFALQRSFLETHEI